MTAAWHLIVGEYPPQPGGVADYALAMAPALFEADPGAGPVRVWCPPSPSGAITPDRPGVIVGREAGAWARADLRRLDVALNATPSPRRLFVQYVPQSFGQRGMNLGFCRWLASRARRGDSVWTMVHEGYFQYQPRRDHPRRWLLSAVQKQMLRIVLGASSRVYMSMPYWESFLRPLEPSRGAPRPMIWLPVPSTIPVIDDPEGVAALRGRVAPGGGPILGHFGTFGPEFRRDLGMILPPLLEAGPGRVALLLGRGGPGFASEFLAAHPDLAGRVIASGLLDAASLSLHLQACDVMIQPYEHGISTRRTTVMACLSHGRAVVTNQGLVTEPGFWDEAGAVAAPPVGDLKGFLAAAEGLLTNASARAALGATAAALYRRRFAVEKPTATLAEDARIEDEHGEYGTCRSTQS